MDISKNKLEDLGQLETKVFKELKKFICSYNYLNVDYLKEVITIFKKSPKIEELNFIGNEIQINKLYKDKLIALNKLKVLDGVTLVLELKVYKIN